MTLHLNVAAVVDDLSIQAEQHELEAVRIRATIHALCEIYSEPQPQAAQTGAVLAPLVAASAEQASVESSAPIETPAQQPGSEAVADDADAAPAGEASRPDASPARPRKIDGEEVERSQKRKQVARLNARHPELTPEEAAARLLIPLMTLRTFTKELDLAWSAARPVDVKPVAEARTKADRIRLMHEAHPTWTARMIANELGEKESTVSTLLAGIRREARAEAQS